METSAISLRARTVGDTTGDVQKLLGRLQESGNALRVVRLLANSDNAFKPFVLMSTALMAKSTLPAADREAVILYLAARRHVQYEWEEHIPMSAAAGITDDQRDLLSAGTVPPSDPFSESQILAIEVAHEVVENKQLSADRWSAAVERWGEPGALDLILVIGWWGGFVPTVIEAFGLKTPS